MIGVVYDDTFLIASASSDRGSGSFATGWLQSRAEEVSANWHLQTELPGCKSSGYGKLHLRGYGRGLTEYKYAINEL
eukprot:423372-Prorocentrum_minimum.AAC.1